LLTHWIETSGVQSLYWVANPTSSLDQLRSFSQAVYNFAGPGTISDEFTFATWENAFLQLERMSQDQRMAIVMDEFTYLLESEPGVAGMLQNSWDHHLKKSNLFLILSGSHIGMMERGLLSYQAPLYGRATFLLKLQPLPFSATRLFFPNYKPDERVAVYALMGGVPAYWELFNPQTSLDANIRKVFLGGVKLLQDEPRLLLQDFVNVLHNYVAILRALAYGHRTPKEIASFVGIPDKNVPSYINNLISTGFIERRVPVGAPESSRAGRHYITDPFLRFYFRFLSSRQAQLALGVQAQTLAEIKKHLIDFIGTHTWEELCREWLLRSTGQSVLPFLPDQIGSIWNRAAQVDVVGINSMEKTIILGECKWDRHPVKSGILKNLVEKTESVVPKEGQWKVYYLGFARQGWAEDARNFAGTVAKSKIRGRNWSAIGMTLKDLEQIDIDLQNWTL
jgi:AAA+ ATPase superfamily predicted ATPase